MTSRLSSPIHTTHSNVASHIPYAASRCVALPVHILRMVFDHFLLNEWACTYRLVCKQWHRCAPFYGRIDLSGTDFTTQRVACLFFQLRSMDCRLISVNLESCASLTDDIVPVLSEIAHLDTLNLRGVPQSAHALGNFSNPSITSCNLSACGLKQKTFHAKNFPHLKMLAVDFSDFSDLSSLAQMTSLRMISLFQTNINDASIKSLSNLKIKKISLGNCRYLSPKVLIHLNRFFYLKELCLNSLPITDTDCLQLQSHRFVRLDLYCCSLVSEKGLSILNPSCLKVLNIGKTKVRDLFFLRKFINLRKLILCYCPIKKESVVHIMNLKKITSIDLSGTAITNKELEIVATGFLRSIHINDCYNITDVGLNYFKSSSNLKELNVFNCVEITEKSLIHLDNLFQSENIKYTMLSVFLDKIKFLKYDHSMSDLVGKEIEVHQAALREMSEFKPIVLILNYIFGPKCGPKMTTIYSSDLFSTASD